jgi:hypothetical protein
MCFVGVLLGIEPPRPMSCRSNLLPSKSAKLWTLVTFLYLLLRLSESLEVVLSQFQTSADISQRRRFFRVWRSRESPRSPIAQSTSGGQRIIEAHSFRPSTMNLPHWLCSSRQLLRESCQRGCMYRSSPGCDHCFRSSKPRRTSRNAVDFFGSGGSTSRLAHRPISLL